jgi:hypothetical protein
MEINGSAKFERQEKALNYLSGADGEAFFLWL